MAERIPIFGPDFKPWSPPRIKWKWMWVTCGGPFCGHSRAIAFAAWRIRWDVKNPSAAMRRYFRCVVCGHKGDVTFCTPAIDANGIEPFPSGRDVIRMGGKRLIPESYPERDARVLAAYLTRYPSGDALSEFEGGPPGPAQMCGKFTAMASWAEVVAFSQPLTREQAQPSDNDREITFRVMSNLPVIIWDREAGQRRVVPMRWGFPDPKNWKLPRPIHARSETIESIKAFASAFMEGQRGIVLVRTFNEAPDIPGPTIQHTITPDDSGAIGIAFVWRNFDLADLPGTMRACVMVTVPANGLIATLPTDRMPAVLADADWATWIGETGTPADAKACLKTVEGVKWTMTKDERAATVKRGKPTVSDPGGLL